MRYLSKVVIDKLKKLKGRTLAVISVIGLLGAIVAASLVQRELSLRSKAGPGPAVLMAVPPNQDKSVGESGSVDVSLNPNGVGASGVELVMQYDSNLIEVNDIQPGDFFTSVVDTVGQPVEIIKDISEPGRIHYAIAFPLGSGYVSKDVKNAAAISFTTKNLGSTSVDFVVDGLPQTKITDVDGNNILSEGLGSTINVIGGARLYFSNPTPVNPQTVGEQFSVQVLADTGGQLVSAIDARINFDANILEVRNIDQGTEASFVSYPSLEYDNQQGTITISTNIGTSPSPQPVNGSGLNIGMIDFYVKNVTSASNITYDYTPGDRNDSNIVLSGSGGDAVDILSGAGSLEIISEAPPAPVCTDTDGGQDYNTKGTVTSTECSGSQVDSCDGDVLQEQYCGSQAECLVIAYTCQYGCTDGACNSEPPPPENDPPIVSFQTPNNGQMFMIGNEIYINASASDTDGTVSNVKLYLNGDFVRTENQSPYEWNSSNDSILGDLWVGSHGLRVVATDDDGATGDASITIIVEEIPQQIIQVRLRFEGRMYSGANKIKATILEYMNSAGTLFGPFNYNTNSQGEFSLPLFPGSYEFLIDTPGYLAKAYRGISIVEGSVSLDLSDPLLGGDFNNDGEINEVDYTLRFMPSFNGADAIVDLDGSGRVNSLDYGIMRENWNLVDDAI